MMWKTFEGGDDDDDDDDDIRCFSFLTRDINFPSFGCSPTDDSSVCLNHPSEKKYA